MRLVTRRAIDCSGYLGYVRRIHAIRYRMLFHRVADSVLDIETGNFREVALRQPDATPEDGDEMCSFQFLRPSIWSVALEAKRADVGRAEQFRVAATVWLVACGAALLGDSAVTSTRGIATTGMFCV